METAQTNQVTDALTDAMANACTACAAKVWNGGACRYHELVGRSNSTTTAMALAAVTAIAVFIVPLSQIESRIDGTKYLKKVYDIAQHLGDTLSSILIIFGRIFGAKNS